MDFPTFSDLLAIASAEALARNSQLSVDAAQREGTDANALLAGAAAVGDEVVGQLAGVSSGLFLNSAHSDALDRLIFDRYGLRRKPAAAALGTVQFSTTAVNPSSFTIPTGLSVSTPTGQTFITTGPVTFPAGSTGPVTASVRSTLAGVDQQAAAHTITSISGQINGAPDDLTVDNAQATAGAADGESDDAFAARAQQFFNTSRRGTLSAIEQGALAVPGVTSAKAQEVVDSNGQPAREVLLAVTDQFTVTLAELGVDTPSYDAQAQALATSVFAGLDDVRAGGIHVKVIVAQVIMLPLELALTFSAGADIDTVTQQAVAVAVSTVNGLPPGATFDPRAVDDPTDGAFATIVGLIPAGCSVVSPAGPVQPTSLQVLRTTPEIVTHPS